jgi:hypothetical protein
MTERGGPMTPKAFYALFGRIGQRAKMPFPVHPHMLRHGCGRANVVVWAEFPSREIRGDHIFVDDQVVAIQNKYVGPFQNNLHYALVINSILRQPRR